MAQRRTRATAEEAPQPDPAAPIDSKRLLKHLTRLLKLLEQDLLARADGSAGLTEALKARHGQEVAAERTADGYDAWRRGVVTQVAAAWVLNAVFVRVLEDRGLVEHARIAGPGAVDSERQFLGLMPYLTERDYLLTVFRELSHFEVTRELFDPKKNLAFRITPSAEGAKQLLAVFRLGSAEAPALRFGQSSTRFLGDLYQDLSKEVRKKYALLQTPDFIEAFILDHTLEPALETYGLDATTLIDPTCGSGHFLLGAFERLFDRQQKEHPNRNERDAALAALGAVYGTDINPYAVSIAKFRLVLAFLDKAGFTKLAAAPAVPLNAAVADSLLDQEDEAQKPQGALAHRGQNLPESLGKAFSFHENDKASNILRNRFAAVVGNPPYINAKDKAQSATYRRLYVSAYDQYSLSAPFVERFFQLCRAEAYVGVITAYSFTKGLYGQRLVEQVLSRIDLGLVANTAYADLAGHGTPTILMFGRNRPPIGATIRTVLSEGGACGTERTASASPVWLSIANHWCDVGYQDEFISVVDTPRTVLDEHPWCLGGDRATDLKELLEGCASKRLSDAVTAIGFAAFSGEDDAFLAPAGTFARLGVEPDEIRTIVRGENVRNWRITPDLEALVPYDTKTNEPRKALSEAARRHLWRYRHLLSRAKGFSGSDKTDDGTNWWEWYRWMPERLSGSPPIVYAYVSTHNHFVRGERGLIYRGGASAPIIILPSAVSESERHALLAYLNSSTACFWAKEVCKPRGGRSASWADRFDYSGTRLLPMPLPPELIQLAPSGCALERLALRRQELLREAVSADPDHVGLFLDKDTELLNAMIKHQEALDWQVYTLFGLNDDEGCCALEDGDRLGERTFEKRLAKKLRNEDIASKWFVAAGVAPPTRAAVGHQEHRLAASERNPLLAFLEDPKYKRWWRTSDVMQTVARALVEQLLNIVEGQLKGADPVVMTPEALAGRSRRTAAWAQLEHRLAEMACPFDAAGSFAHLAVPYLSALCYAASGREKRARWLATWAMQRDEDAGQVCDDVPDTPRYQADDYLHDRYWTLRGKLDVFRERFISYPGCESDDDKSPVYGWAGWNHLQRAQALAGLYQARKDEGWEATRLLPMLVGLIELLPWLHQYHGEPDESLGGERPADQFEAFVAEELRLAGKTREQAEREVLAWAQQRGGGAQRKARPARARPDEALETDTDADESAPDSEPASGAPSSRAALKPPSRAKPPSKSKPANDIDSDEARTANQATRRGGKGGGR